MAQVKKGDFIEIDYTGKTKEDSIVFDTTIEKDAKENSIHNDGAKYEPIIVCVGERHVLSGIDKSLVGKEPGSEYAIELQPEEAFGKKDPKLLQMIPAARFKKDNVMPMVGMQVNVDNSMGIVKTASGGRILVDFNHPLSGKNVVYKIKINRAIEDDAEKLKGLLKTELGLKETKAEIKDGNAIVTFEQKIPKEIEAIVEEKVKRAIPSVKSLHFALPEDKKQDIENKH